MFIYKNAHFYISFSDASSGITAQEHTAIREKTPHTVIARLQQPMQLDNLIFLRQTHSITGMHITHLEQARSVAPFQHEGDYIITSVPNIGIGVLTADCVPVVMYAPDKHIISVVHAGWRGAVSGIIQSVIQQLCELGCDMQHLQVFIGPSAKVCCYQVQTDFYHTIPLQYQSDVLCTGPQDYHYFDLPLLVIMELWELGVPKGNINENYSVCSICDHSLYSHRRQAAAAGRNVTIVRIFPSIYKA